MERIRVKSLDHSPFYPSVHTAPFFPPHLCTTAPEHFNACQQYVQQTSCAFKHTRTHTHTHTHTHARTHARTHTHTVYAHSVRHYQVRVMNKSLLLTLSFKTK